MAKREQSTWYNFKVTNADGTSAVSEHKNEKQYNEAVAAAEKLPGTTVDILKAQTFEIEQAESIDEILTLVPNADVALEHFNYGYKLGQQNVKRNLMTDNEWEPVEGVYILSKDVQQPAQKRVADPAAASRRALKAYAVSNGLQEPTDEEIQQALEMLKSIGRKTAETAA